MIYQLFFAIMLLFSGCIAPELQDSRSDRATGDVTVVLSLDGFRHDYPEKVFTPHLDSIATVGVRASLEPVFPSKTFPNHYSMATGLYPEHHGLVSNSFYDERKKEYFSLSNRSTVNDPDYYGGEPIWQTAQKQGVKTATFFWVGSDVAINGRYPDIWKPYDGRVPFSVRLDSVISWLAKPAQERPGLIMWYYHEPDSWGHKFGPESGAIMDKIAVLDSLVGRFNRKVRALPNRDSINVIILSDHGMGQLSADKRMFLTDYLSEEMVLRYSGSSPFYMIEPKQGMLDSTFAVLETVEHLSVWKKGEVPEALHYGDHDRIMSLVAVADSAWSLEWDHGRSMMQGTHGYVPSNKDMHAIFYAYGPAFRKNIKGKLFSNLHIYPLLVFLLGLESAPVDVFLDEDVLQMLHTR